MRCTDCKCSKETIPAQKHYAYCTKYEKEMSTTTEFEDCQYRQTDEYKIKVLIQDFCNNEGNWVVGIGRLDLLNSLANKFNIPNFVQDIKARRNFEKKVFKILNSSKIKLESGVLVRDLGEGEERRDGLFILQKPKNF